MRVAWEEEAVEVSPDALALVARRRHEFLEFVAAHPDRKFYGVNVHAGEGSDRLLSPAEQRDYERGLHAGTSFGEPLPRRVVRGIAFARLANFVEGHSGVSAELVAFVAAMLDGRPLPPVPRYGNGGAGEIQALGWLFGDVGEQLPLGLKEGMALINGAPCAPAMLADACLSADLMIGLFEAVACLAAAALSVPLATYDERLGALWGDPWQASALAGIRVLLAGADDASRARAPAAAGLVPDPAAGARQRAPGAFGGARGRRCGAAGGQRQPRVPRRRHHLQRRLSQRGSAGCIDSLTFALADFAQLAQHMVQRLQTSPYALPGLDSLALGTMQMVAGGFAEEARAAAVPSLLPLVGIRPDRRPGPVFLCVQPVRARAGLPGRLGDVPGGAGRACAGGPGARRPAGARWRSNAECLRRCRWSSSAARSAPSSSSCPLS